MMRLAAPWRWPLGLALAALLAAAPAARAQPAPPRVGYVYPAGGQQGTTFQVTLGGQRLADVSTAVVSGAGAQTRVVAHTKPLTPKEANDLRERVQELRKGKMDPAVIKELAEIRTKLQAFAKKANPALAETVTLEVALAPDAAPGERELRLVAPTGVSNPLVFCVGQLPEFREPPPKPDALPQGPRQANPDRRPAPAAPEPDTPVALPAVVNGQIMPGDVDRFRFEAHRGQRLVVAAGARTLIPYLADAVPGWFQATLALYDAQGREVAYVDDYAFRPDPVLFYEIPADGAYVLEIKDAIYRGREDFVYRVAVGELPFVTGVFPLGGRAGAPAAVQASGWNLPAARLAPDTAAPGVHTLTVRRGELVSNPRPFAVDTLPETLEKEPNNRPEDAQPLALPVIVNGRVDPPGDRDVFRFDARAGDEVVAEVHARRLESPLDSVLRLTDAAGKQVAANDDCEDKGSGLNTHHADSCLRVALPAAGTYYLHLGDTRREGGPTYAYRLRVGPPRPDFELRVTPSSLTARGGMSVPLTVYALRRDGFSGEIALALKGAPPGFALAGGRVPAGQDGVRVTLAMPTTPPREPLALALEGRATIGGREVVREAVPAEDMMQAFAYRHLVPAEELMVSVSGRAGRGMAVRLPAEGVVRIPAGGTVRLPIGLPPGRFVDRIDLELSEPPDGITLRDVPPGQVPTEIVFQTDAAKAKPGLAGNLIVNVYGTRTQPPPGAAAAPAAKPPAETKATAPAKPPAASAKTPPSAAKTPPSAEKPPATPAAKTPGRAKAKGTAKKSPAPPAAEKAPADADETEEHPEAMQAAGEEMQAAAAKAPAADKKAPPAAKAPAERTAPASEKSPAATAPAAKAPAAKAPAAEKAAPPAPKAPAAPRRFLIGTLPAIPFEVVAP